MQENSGITITAGRRYIDDLGRVWNVYENHEVPCAHSQFLCRSGNLFAVVGRNGVGNYSHGSFVLKEIDEEHA